MVGRAKKKMKKEREIEEDEGEMKHRPGFSGSLSLAELARSSHDGDNVMPSYGYVTSYQIECTV